MERSGTPGHGDTHHKPSPRERPSVAWWRKPVTQSYANFLYHIVFSTMDREPLIVEAYQTRLYEYIGGIIRKQGGLKAHSSGWLHKTFPEIKGFVWQQGYGAFTVSASQVEFVRSYIERQKMRHRTRTFKDEFISFLRAHRVEFDERYL